MHDQLFAQAVEHHRAGRLQEAHGIYARILNENPDDLRALESLAQIHFSTGDPTTAVELLVRATSLDPVSAGLRANLGIALAACGRFEEAVAALGSALLLSPANPQIIGNLAQVHADHGAAMYQGRRLKEAITALRCATFLQPDHPGALNNLAVVLQEVGDLAESERACRRVIEKFPDFGDGWYNLGRILQDKGHQQEAGEAFARAVALQPQSAPARNNLAMTFQAVGKFDEAIEHYRRVIEEHPSYDEARINLGVALKESGRVDEAIAHYRELLNARPDLEEARWNLGLTQLLSGDFENGWKAAEARRKIPRLECDRNLANPQWQGEPLEGRTILLHAEQGFGDTIQFVRYAPMVRDRGGRVIVMCQPGLIRLIRGQFDIDQIISIADPLPHCDVHCPLLTLPLVFETRLGSIPARVPYIAADAKLSAGWTEKLRAIAERKVGIAWAGNPRHVNDACRSIPAAVLEPLWDIPGVRFVSLQKPMPPGNSANAPLLVDLTDGLTDFAETAALIDNLDLVITVDTAVAHLAGAMGKPVWLMLPTAPDWRWMLGRSDSPWYPTMRIFRQRAFSDWGPVIREIIEAIL